MRAEDLIRDPVFQLNLLVWAAREQPAEPEARRVTPLFHDAGFRIFYIERPFTFPVPIQQRLADVEDIGRAPSADLVLTHRGKATALYIEAKKDSFGVGSSNCRQARAHLIATGPAFTEVYPTVTACQLVYALPEARRTQMEATLASLAADVVARGFVPGPTSVHGFSLQPGHVMYHVDESTRTLLDLQEARVPLLPVPDDGETDPSPLLLVYTDSDRPDGDDGGYYRRILVQQVHAQLLCQLHLADPAATQVLSVESLLQATTGGVYEFLGGDTRKSMRVIVRDNVFKRLAGFWSEKKPGVFTLRGFELVVAFGDTSAQEEVLDWLENSARVNFKDAPADQAEIDFDGPLPSVER